MAKVLFRYKPIRGHLAPLITLGIRLEQRWQPIEAYLDSGAAYSVLHARLAEAVGLEYRRGDLTYLQVGDGSFIPVYLHEIELQIGPVRFPAPVGFSDRLGVSFNLLGRTGVFSRFTICFEERRGFVTLDSGD